MTMINLRKYYPFYTNDYFVEVPDDIVSVYDDFERREAAYRLYTYRHKAYYSLDREDGIEHEAIFSDLSPMEIYERKVTSQELQAAMASLPVKQAKRIYAHFILGMSQTEIAKTEKVSKMAVCYSIERALKAMESFLKNRLD